MKPRFKIVAAEGRFQRAIEAMLDSEPGSARHERRVDDLIAALRDLMLVNLKEAVKTAVDATAKASRTQSIAEYFKDRACKSESSEAFLRAFASFYKAQTSADDRAQVVKHNATVIDDANAALARFEESVPVMRRALIEHGLKIE